MNNNIDRQTKIKAMECKEWISIACEDSSAKKQIIRGGGLSGGELTKLLMIRPIKSLRISENALKLCIEHNVKAYDYFILPSSVLRKKYGNFFASNEKSIDKCHEIGHYLTGDHNIPNKCIIQRMLDLYDSNSNADVDEYKKILNEQSYDLITLEENKALNDNGLQSKGTKEERDALCSKKYELLDLWLTPQYVIDKFFELTNLDKNNCLDPCACDGRWLNEKGMSIDIIPMAKNVLQKDFLTLEKNDLPSNINTIVGNVPFSLLDEFVNKALSLCDDCYFLVSGDTIFKHFPNNIEHLYIFSGLEGKQKDNRSRCEFDVPHLYKSALWCCIVHLTKKEQPKWIIESDLSNEAKRDGKHIAIGKNTFIKLETEVENDNRISQIPVHSDIIWKDGKKVKIDDEIFNVKDGLI